MAPPADRYVEYYTEKLWELVPAYHRHEDGIGDHPGALRAIVHVWANEAAKLRRSQDRLWEDTFVDLADDWAVPYLADLVGTRLVSALNSRGRRIDVAKTIYYRRRKGTPRVLEELVADITGWEGKVVEAFRGLARFSHGFDPAPPAPSRFSRTSPGGWADLRDVRAAALADGPWDEFAHVADVRRARGLDGRWNIPKVIFHLWRLGERRIAASQPFVRAGGLAFTFDPSGRDVPLFAPRARPEAFDWDDWRSALPWDVPAPIPCRLLGHAEHEIEEQLLQDLVAASLITDPQADELRPLVDVRHASEARLRDQLAIRPSAATFLAPGVYDAILAGSLVEDCGKRALLPLALSVTPAGTPVPRERTVAGNLSTWSIAVPTDKELVVDPDRGRFLLTGVAPPAAGVRVMYHDGFPGRVGAGTYDRSASVVSAPTVTYTGGAGAIAAGTLPINGSAEVTDSLTYSPVAGRTGITQLILQARDRERPYLRLAADWALVAAGGIEADLVLDGLWVGATAAGMGLVLQGAWHTVTIRHCTFDPGGTDVDGNPIHPVSIFVDGQIDELLIDRSIVSRVSVIGSGLIDRVVARDSILHPPAATPAIALTPGTVELARATVLGGLDVERLQASEALIVGLVDVTDTHGGCFRFSAAPAGSRLPRPYRSHVITDVPSLFTSRRFGHPGYTQLGAAAPAEIVRGAEDGSEIGVWSHLANPIKLDSFERKVAEYLPFGLIPSFFPET